MASKEILKLFKIEKLKEEQSAILKCILEGRDCMAVLPTGFALSDGSCSAENEMQKKSWYAVRLQHS